MFAQSNKYRYLISWQIKCDYSLESLRFHCNPGNTLNYFFEGLTAKSARKVAFTDHPMLWIWTAYPLLRNAVCNWTLSILAYSLKNLLEYVESCDREFLFLFETDSKLKKVQNETPSSLSIKWKIVVHFHLDGWEKKPNQTKPKQQNQTVSSSQHMELPICTFRTSQNTVYCHCRTLLIFLL